MLDNAKIQGGLVAYIKEQTEVTSLLANVNEVREDSWKGTDFAYPHVRVEMLPLRLSENQRCALSDSDASIIIFSEEKSSKEADTLAGVVAEQLRGKSFVRNGVRFSSISVDVIFPAMPTEERWRSEVSLKMIVSLA